MNKLQKDGYSRYDLMKSLNYEGIEQDYNEILAYFADLPEDDYAPNLNRYRRYSRAIVLPGTEDVFGFLPLKEMALIILRIFKGSLIQNILAHIENSILLMKI